MTNARCRHCGDEFESWPEALDHNVTEHPHEIAKQHKSTGLEAIEPARETNGGRVE